MNTKDKENRKDMLEFDMKAHEDVDEIRTTNFIDAVRSSLAKFSLFIPKTIRVPKELRPEVVKDGIVEDISGMFFVHGFTFESYRYEVRMTITRSPDDEIHVPQEGAHDQD